MRLTINDKFWVRHDKVNSKYNRLWEQTSNIFLFILASLVAYSIAYIQFVMENPLRWGIFLGKLIFPLLFILVPVSIILTILITLLIITGKEVHSIVESNRIF